MELETGNSSNSEKDNLPYEFFISELGEYDYL